MAECPRKSVKGVFVAYLRGIETGQNRAAFNTVGGFVAYLRGIETDHVTFVAPFYAEFVAYLRGIETQGGMQHLARWKCL